MVLFLHSKHTLYRKVGVGMNKEMMYQLFLNSIKNMNDEELKGALMKVKGMVSEDDYKKLEELIEKEKNKN